MPHPSHAIVLLILILSLSALTVLAQSTDCPVIVSQALEQVGQLCGNLGANQVCYGNTNVQATAWDSVTPSGFEVPGDTADLTLISSLITAPMDAEEQVWGVAMMSLQANLPGTIPGQNVTFIVFGDTEIESEFRTGEAPAPPRLEATTTRPMNVRGGPGTQHNVVSELVANVTITVVGRALDGEWLMADFDGSPLWVYTAWMDVSGDISTLPIVGLGDPVPAAYDAPMQAFRFSTGVGLTNCEQLPPDGLLVQAPQNTAVNFSINGVDVEVGSTGILTPSQDGSFQTSTLTGTIEITTQDNQQALIPGYQTSISADGDVSEVGIYDYETVRQMPVHLLPDPVNVPVTVPGALIEGWLDSGISIESGQTYILTAYGSVNVWSDCEVRKFELNVPDFDCALNTVGPQGGLGKPQDFLPQNAYAYPMPDELIGTLLGRIGDEKPFVVGDGGTFIANARGVLQFRTNDDYLRQDNTGGFVVTVEIQE